MHNELCILHDLESKSVDLFASDGSDGEDEAVLPGKPTDVECCCSNDKVAPKATGTYLHSNVQRV